jgi:hypothetical protein
MSKDAKSMIWDYLVFVIFVIASTFVAVYSRFFGPKEKTKADFVFAAGKVSMAAMMLSIARGTLGVRSFLGEYDGTTFFFLHSSSNVHPYRIRNTTETTPAKTSRPRCELSSQAIS